MTCKNFRNVFALAFAAFKTVVPILGAVSLTLLIAAPASAQSSPADGPWTGSMQCQVDVEQTNYSRHETQTWTLTGTKLPPNGDMRIYEVIWTATGQGKYLTAAPGGQGAIVDREWSINVPPTVTQFSFRMSGDNLAMFISQWSSPQRADNAVSGTSQVITNGNPGQSQPIHYPVHEWPFGIVREGALSTNLTGTRSIMVGSLGAGTEPITGQAGGRPAVCKWQFTKGATSSETKSESQNCSQAAAAISQTFDAMEADVTKQFDALIQQTKDPTRGAMLSDEEKSLLRQLEAQKQQNLKAISADCNANAGAKPGQSSPGSGMSGSNSGSTTGSSQPGGTDPGSQRSPAPQLLSVAPGSVEQGKQGVQLTFAGRATHWQMGTTTLNLGPGITAQAGPFFTSQTDGYVVISVARDASIGSHAATLSTGTETVGLPAAFTVTAPIGAIPDNGPRGPVAKQSPPDLSQKLTLPNANPAKTFPKDGKPISNQPPAAATTSGSYLITITGLKCVKATLDDPLGLDGKGDEIYALAFREVFNRSTGEELDRAVAQTLVYGDTNQAPDRVQAGSKSPLGGIQDSDFIPSQSAVSKRLLPAEDSRFPLKVWEGRMTDGVEVLVISPSIWESDGDQMPAGRWLQNMQTVGGSQLLLNQQLQTQIVSKAFGAVDLGATQGAGSLNHSSIVIAGQQDRPIGVVSNGPASTVLPHTAIVLTREIIENTAFRREPSASSTKGVSDPNFDTFQNVTAGMARNWALLQIDFTDNVTGPALGADTPAHYIMYVQIERE